MSTYLENLASHFVEARDRLDVLTEGMADDMFNAKPSAKGWSVGECVTHLNIVSKGYLPVLEAALTADAPRGGGPFRYSWLTRRFIAALTPGSRPIPTGGPMKPPATTGPRSDIDRGRALARFHGDTERFLALCTEADGYELARVKVASPFLPILRFNFGGILEALAVHSVRHVAQAERAAASVQTASG